MILGLPLFLSTSRVSKTHGFRLGLSRLCRESAASLQHVMRFATAEQPAVQHFALKVLLSWIQPRARHEFPSEWLALRLVGGFIWLHSVLLLFIFVFPPRNHLDRHMTFTQSQENLVAPKHAKRLVLSSHLRSRQAGGCHRPHSQSGMSLRVAGTQQRTLWGANFKFNFVAGWAMHVIVQFLILFLHILAGMKSLNIRYGIDMVQIDGVYLLLMVSYRMILIYFDDMIMCVYY